MVDSKSLLGFWFDPFRHITCSRSSQTKKSDKTPESVSEDVSPALLLEVLLALGLLVVVPKSLLVVVPSLASVVIHDSWRCETK